MNHRLPISVCMIASAEAARIGRSLEAVANCLAETHVVSNEAGFAGNLETDQWMALTLVVA